MAGEDLGPLPFLDEFLDTWSCLPSRSVWLFFNWPPISGCSSVPNLFLVSLSIHPSIIHMLSVHPPIHPSVYPPIHPSTHPSIVHMLSVHPPIHLSSHPCNQYALIQPFSPSFHPPAYSTYPSSHGSFRLSTHQPIHPLIYLSTHYL